MTLKHILSKTQNPTCWVKSFYLTLAGEKGPKYVTKKVPKKPLLRQKDPLGPFLKVTKKRDKRGANEAPIVRIVIALDHRVTDNLCF